MTRVFCYCVDTIVTVPVPLVTVLGSCGVECNCVAWRVTAEGSLITVARCDVAGYCSEVRSR